MSLSERHDIEASQKLECLNTNKMSNGCFMLHDALNEVFRFYCPVLK